MITPTNINAYINTKAKITASANEHQQAPFLDLLAMGDRNDNLTVDNAQSRMNDEKENPTDNNSTTATSGDEVINLFAGLQFFLPQLKQQEAPPSVNQLILPIADELASLSLENTIAGRQIVEKEFFNAVESYALIDRAENPVTILPTNQASNEKVTASRDDNRFSARVAIAHQQPLDTLLDSNAAQITPDELSIGQVATPQDSDALSLITIKSIDFDNLNTPAEQVEWKFDTSQITPHLIQQEASSSLTTIGLYSQQSLKVSSAIDLKWYATGKLSATTKILQMKSVAASEIHSASNTLIPAGYLNQALPLQSGNQPSPSHASAIPASSSSRLQNGNWPGGEKTPPQNLVSTAIALSFPELSKRKLTIVENNGTVDVIVRDYALSEDEKKSLSVFLTHYFKSVDKPVHSLTFNGKIYSQEQALWR